MTAREVVDAIIADLSDRRMGWDSIDSELQDEIREKWRGIVSRAVEAAVKQVRGFAPDGDS